ncbi:hypothetical protein JYG23_12385 [Sedimentibacter sp. zth1]|uniref:hypothetical protein n=1 Tax=Sedimentibacter sp. zth1 TaxID=2816908 RepID=UPI001A91D036|nr:hypothetical protein [Sedimentibacter sp. zth1]QSX05466.1 hypothetical protein JYG23_12385 [Sedimentibacter sp. zth1]
MNKIILATGSEELNNAVIEYASNKNNYNFEQVHYREFLLEEGNDFSICVISGVLPGEIKFDRLIYMLRSKDIRVILILLEENKTELEICIKYHVTDVLTQPVKPVDIIDAIENPKTFKDIEFIYKKMGLSLELDIDKTDSKKSAKKNVKKSNNTEKTVKEIIKYKQSIIGVKNIGVVCLSHGAGATFFTLNFAKALSEITKVAVVEHPLINPKIYNTIGIANYIDEARDFVSYAHNIAYNKIDKNKAFAKDNITYIVTDPNREKISSDDWDENNMLRLLYVSKIPINIIDLGNQLFDTSIINIIEQFSLVIIIIDPYIPNILENLHTIEKIKKLEENKSVNIKYVINKYNDGVDKSELLNNLDIEPIAYIPYLDPQYVYKATSENKIPYNYKYVKEKLEKPMTKLAKNILPKEIEFKKQKHRINILSKIKSKRR